MQQIPYKTIIDLGFEVEECHDPVYEAQYGFQYKIFTYQLRKKLFIQWDQVTRTCEMYRIDSPKTGNILAQMPIETEAQLNELIEFFK